MTQYRHGEQTTEQRARCPSKPELPVSPLVSTLNETRCAMLHDAVKHGLFVLKNLVALDFVSLVERVEQIAQKYNRDEWRKAASDLYISVQALKTLDACEPPIPYPFYFCIPDILIQHPELVTYYHNVAMISPETMGDMGFSTMTCEAGQTLAPDIAADLARRLNHIISTLMSVGTVTPQRHLEMAYANLGGIFEDLWRSETAIEETE